MPRVLQFVLCVSLCFAPVYGAQLWMQETRQQSSRADADVRKYILIKLAQEPQLRGLSISVTVDAQRVLLSGRVHTIAQRDIALKIARDHADGRQVIDDFEIIR